MFASDAKTLLDMGLLHGVKRDRDDHTPRTHQDAELLARTVREDLIIGDEALLNLTRVCEQLGFYTYAAPLGLNGPDGGCVEIAEGNEDIAVAVVNGHAPAGRRRMTVAHELAHELGHWLCGDAYDHAAGDDCEKMINSFATSSPPRAGVTRIWTAHRTWSNRDRALAVGSVFRLSWTAAIGQLKNLDLISHDEFEKLRESEPRHGEYVRLEVAWDDEPKAPVLSPAFAAACVRGYTSGQLTAARTIELLRSTMTRDEVPEREPEPIEDIRKLFVLTSD